MGGGGTDDRGDGREEGPVVEGSGIAPGWGGAGDWEEVVVGGLVVGVAVRLLESCEVAVAVEAGRLGAAPGCAMCGFSSCAVAYMGGYGGAVAVADALGGCAVAVVADSLVVAGSGWEVVVCVASSSDLLGLRGEEM